MNYKYKIYQLKSIANTNYAFRSWNSAENEFTLNDYNLVYESEKELNNHVTDIDVLEHLYMIFNLNHPEDFKGRSLSVSDCVKVNNTLYYCDDIGWKRVVEK